MIYGGTRAPALLLFGDLVVFSLSLWGTLFIRTGSFPTLSALENHIGPFAFLFMLWIALFYMAGLYSKRAILVKGKLPQVLIRAQVVNIVFAALFFFLVPGVGIAPKTNLAIYLIVSVLGIFAWRLSLYPRMTSRKKREPAVLIAEGLDAEHLVHEVNTHTRYPITFATVIAPDTFAAMTEDERQAILPQHTSAVVADMAACSAHNLLPVLYDLPRGVEKYDIVDFGDLYEEVFDRVPLSVVSQSWLRTYALTEDSFWYLFPKRCIDVLGALGMGLATLVALPFVWGALRSEGSGPLFIRQQRIGKRGAPMTVYKFRTMTHTDDGAWKGETQNTVTKVGAVLRQISLDEFPQFWNILKGELSLIGPRSDIENLAYRLEESIPHYSMRYAVTPGITGWAQITQEYAKGNLSPQSVEESEMRLAYDFYYLKYRSLGLDIMIALKTAKRMFFRFSSW